MKNVVFFIGSLQAGGTEAKLARNFLPLLKSRGKMNPKLLLLKEMGEFLEVLPQEIERFSLHEEADTNILRVIPRFRNALRRLKADVVISCMWYPAIISYMARTCGGMNFRHIVHDTTNMTEYIKYEFGHEKYQWAKLCLIRKAYKKADSIIVVSEGERNDLIENFSVPERLVQVVYNPIDIKSIRHMSEMDADLDNDKPLVVSVGRIIYSKGFDILIRAFRIVRDRIDCRLVILGKGVERDRLEELSAALNLSKDITFLGFHHNPFKFMRKAMLFCTATRYEGLGNAIIEAMALGLPVIATDCRSGPGETLKNGEYGILVPPEKPEAIAEAIIKILSDSQLKRRLSDLSLRRAEDFSPEKALSQWEDIVLRV